MPSGTLGRSRLLLPAGGPLESGLDGADRSAADLRREAIAAALLNQNLPGGLGLSATAGAPMDSDFADVSETAPEDTTTTASSVPALVFTSSPRRFSSASRSGERVFVMSTGFLAFVVTAIS